MRTYHYPLPNFEARSLVLFASFVLCSSASVWAQTSTPSIPAEIAPAASAPDSPTLQAQHSFARADLDADGFLTHQEAQNLPAVFEKFDQWDRDGDGKISREEFLNAARAQSNP